VIAIYSKYNRPGEIRASVQFPTWIEDGEKYGLVGLTIKLDGHLPSGKISPNLWVLADTKFNVPSSWREWLGTICVEEVEECNLFLLAVQSELPTAHHLLNIYSVIQ
jgi:hypothetical protein